MVIAMREKPPSRGRAALVLCGVIIAGVTVLGLTITPPPNPALADEIDRLFEQNPCVGDVDRWPSRYYVWVRPGWSNTEPRIDFLWLLTGPWLGSGTSKVDVRFYAGADTDFYPPGRHRLRADQDRMALDSSDMLFVAGTYDVKTRSVADWTCGPNIS